MKKAITIFFLVVYVFTSTECNQLLKLPKLFGHFSEHKALNHNISFSDFLYMHYTDHDLNDNDQDKDMQLPFKSHNDCASVSFTPFLTTADLFTLRPLPVVAQNFVVYKRLNFQSSFLSSIWQPPKSC